MPSMPITRDTAWDYWSRGLIAAANIDLTIESFSSADSNDPNGYSRKVLANLTLKRNYNAFRLWFGYADRFSIYAKDIVAIALYGWDSTVATSGGNTIAGVAAQVTNILDSAQKLGAGIFMVTDFNQGPTGLLWSTSSSDLVKDPVSGSQTSYTYRDILKMFWVNTLTKWKSHAALIGFDLVNEPNPFDSPQTNSSGNVVFDAKLSSHRALPNGWPQLAQTIINAIRAKETQLGLTTPMPLIVEGIYTGGPNGLMVFDVPSGSSSTLFLTDGASPRIVYSFHYYGPGCVTSQGVDQWNYENMGTPYPMPGVSYDPYWYDGTPYGEFNTHASTDDVLRDVSRAITFKQRHPEVPIFVGEFSCCQPSITQVYPPDPNRVANSPNMRVSEVQNTVTWQAPQLAQMAAVATQADANALVAIYGASLYNDVFGSTKRRWITQLEISADGKKMIATLGHTADPADVDSGGFNYGFRVWTSPLTAAQLASYAASVNEQAVPSNGTQFATKFTSQPMAKVVGIYSWTNGSGQLQTINTRASALNMSTSQQVTLTRHATTIEFAAPAGAVAGTKYVGATVTLPTDASDSTKTASVQMPVALLWLDSPSTGTQIDQARLKWAQDALYVWQQKGFSWAWHSEDTGGPVAAVMWRPSKDIGELLSVAASGRHIAKRTS
ncbi:MAG: hypothetical protein EKK47_10715 [Burkholderiales bacterium]|jgi:hypothetical protein|nr:MAG: hypothetical protein EKK47_10715 [Burkholderiales bacterium]